MGGLKSKDFLADLMCDECKHEWAHPRWTWVGRDKVGFVKDGWGILRCPNCKSCHGVKLLKIRKVVDGKVSI